MTTYLRNHNLRGPAIRRLPRCTWITSVLALLISFAVQGATMSGTYTVCTSGCDYSTVSAAISDLNSRGVGGAVTFDIKAGTYNESFSLSSVTGMSATNTVTLKGAGMTKTRIYKSSTNYVVQVAAKYYTLQDLWIDQTNNSPTYSNFAALNIYYADNTTVKNCQLTAPVGSIYYAIPFYLNYSSNCTITGNRLYGGYYTAYISNSNSTYLYGNNLFKNNKILGSFQYGVYSYGSGNDVWDGNIIDSSNYSYSYALMSYYEGGGQTYKNNYIGTTFYFGFYIYYPAYYSQKSSLDFINNMLNMGSNTYYGIYIYNYSYPSNTRFLHNTVHMQGSSGYNFYLYNSYGTKGYTIRNNNFTRSGTGTLFYYPVASSVDVIDGNNYYNTGGTLLYYNNTNYTDIPTYQATAANYGHGTFDQKVLVKYKSVNDLHIDQTIPAPNGPYAGVATDFDGDARCTSYPTSGADESYYVGAKPTAKFTGPSSVIDGTPVTFLNSANPLDKSAYHWYVDNVKVSDSFHLFTTALKGKTSAVVKLVAQSCSGKDSVQKTVTITQPTSTPVTDFLADYNVIKTGDKVKFTDISTGGASSWQWSITPDSTYNNGNKVGRYQIVYKDFTSPVFQVRFDFPGKYKVCLTTSNSKGKGTTECKVDYIEVMPNILMRSTSVVRDPQGLFYDDGGPNADYFTNSGLNSILFDPCASAVYMKFNYFQSECGYDYMRIYDGADKTGKPLYPCTTNNGYDNNGPGFTGESISACTYACLPSPKDTFVAKSGKMYIEFLSDPYVTAKGWEAQFWSTPKVGLTKPKAGFTSKDSVCTNNSLLFTNTSTGTDIVYLWDLDGDITTFEYTGSKFTSWAYFFPGKYKITLIASNCGGADTFTKTITVFDPPAPKPSMSADNTNPTNTDVVFFSSSTKQCVDAYTWKFKWAYGNGTATFVNGTSKSSAAPQVTFSDTGCWTATLITSNVSGVDSITNSCFIRVKAPYCTPAVTNLVPDIGISEVEFNTIDNKSPQGTTGYTSYVATVNTTVEIGVKYKLTVERTTNKNKVNRTAFIDWNGDGDFADFGETAAQDLNSSTLSWSTDITIPSYAKLGATVMRIAINQGNLSNDPCGPNTFGEYEDYRLYITKDLTPPVISLRSHLDTTKFVTTDTIRLEKGRTYVEPGFKAIDNLSGDVTSQVVVTSTPSFDNLIERTYKFAYNVKDAAGNAAITRYRVVIVTPDVTAPDLVVEKPDTVYVAVGKTFTMPKVTRAFDLVEGDLLNPIDQVVKNNPVNTSVVDTYTVTYTVTDQASNTAKVVRTVIVIDTVAPVIKLVGGATVYQDVNVAYTDSGVTLSDNYYSDAQLRKNLQMQSNVDVTKPGTYTVVYSLTDPSGNKAKSVTRTVIVLDREKPVLTLIGDTLITMDVNTKLADPGILITDNFDKITKWDTLGTFYQTFANGFANKTGAYTIIYRVTDKSGNTATVSRNIMVVDRIAPVITLKGSPTVTICRWSTYQDSGYVVTDNYDKPAAITISKEGTFIANNAMLEGIYTFRYKAVDASKNVSYSDWRYILVQLCNTGIADLNAADKSVNIFPNPSSGLFNVSVSGTQTANITVTNMMGQTIGAVINQGVGNNYTLDLRGQSAGVYLLNITTGDKTVTKRIVVEK